VQVIDRRRLDYVENLVRARGVAPGTAQARTQVLYWAFLGYALSDQPMTKVQREAMLDELVRIASQ
jgi:hypothetical protein